jgi:hypothetical protein
MKYFPAIFVLSLSLLGSTAHALEPRLSCVEDRLPVGAARITVKLERRADGKYTAEIERFTRNMTGAERTTTTVIDELGCKYEVQVTQDQEAIELKTLNCGQERYVDGKRKSIWFGLPNERQVAEEGSGYRITETTYTARPGWGEVAVSPETSYARIGEFGFNCQLNMPVR